MKHLEDLTVKELRQAAKELNIKGRSKMNKAELVEALKTRQPKKIEANQKTNQEANQKTNTEGQLIRIWHDVVRTLPVGTPVTVKMFSNKDIIKTFTGRIKEGNRKRDDGLPDVFIKVGAKKPFNLQLYDNIQVFMTEKDFQKAKYSK